MLTILRNVLEVIENVPQYILYAIETVANLFFSGIQGIFTVATSLIPLPPVPGPPEYISQINWFFPIGAVITIMGPIVVGYISFLLVRWALKWSGAL